MDVAPFNIANFQGLTPDLRHFNVFDAAYNGMKFAVRTSQRIVLDSSMAFNLPGLAYKYLGTESLWWALLMYNGLSDPLNDVKAGTTLNIPDRISLIAYLNRPVGDSGVQVPSISGASIL